MYSSFENQWREALRDAEENPPIDVWRNIETKLDQEFLAEAIIKNKLVTASEIPDSFVWDNIASALEEDRKPVFFMWFNKYTATGIAALLLLALSFSIFKSPFGTAENKVSKASTSIEIPDSKISENKSEKHVTESADRGPKSEIAFNKTGKSTSSISNKVDGLNSLSNVSKTSKATTASSDNIISSERSVGSESSEASLVKTFMALKTLLGKGFDPYGNSFVLKRNKLSYNTPDEYLANNKNFIQRSWFGLMSGISPFDPNFKISNFERAALVSASDVPVTSFEPNSVSTNPIQRETFAIPLSQPYNDVKAGNSINIGFNYGKRIKNRFSIGTGIRYMAGRSLVASNVYSYNERTGSVSTFLESYYIRGESSFTNNTVISSGGDIDNEYKFLMIPLNVGYHLPITEKLEASFITGVSGDFIINNVFDNLPEAGSKLTASNSAYKPLNLSGIAGVKMNYMVRDNWEISVGSNVQQTLTSGVDRAEGFTFKPRYLGINYGVNYRFN